MGMFDNIKCEYSLSDPEMQDSLFQTKDLNNLLDNYTITEDGLLLYSKVKWQYVPEEERPYYGTKEWDENPLMRTCGCLKTTYLGEEFVNYTGDIIFYTINRENDSLISYRASFVEGKITEINRYNSLNL